MLTFILSACSGSGDRGFQVLPQSDQIIGGAEITADDILTRQALSFRSYYDPVVKKTEKDGTITTTTSYKVLQCTAAAISPRLILTAAHCVHPEPAIQRLELKTALGHSYTRDVVATATHPKYNKDNKIPDLAILLLEEDLPEDIEILALPSKGEDLKLTHVTAAGFGRNDGLASAKATGTGVLRATTLKVLEYSAAKPVLSVDQSEGKGICQGDSGGPAMAEIEGNIYVVGVASRSIYNDQVPAEQLNYCNLRGEYVNVQYEMDWITETVDLLLEAL